MNGIFLGSTSRRNVSMRGSSVKERNAKSILADAQALRVQRSENRRREKSAALLAGYFRRWKHMRMVRRESGYKLAELYQLWESGSRTVELFREILRHISIIYVGRPLKVTNCYRRTLDGFSFDVDSQLFEKFLTAVSDLRTDGAYYNDYLKHEEAAAVVFWGVRVAQFEIAGIGPETYEFHMKLHEAALNLCLRESWKAPSDSAGVFLKCAPRFYVLAGYKMNSVFEFKDRVRISNAVSAIMRICLQPLLREDRSNFVMTQDDIEHGDQEGEDSDWYSLLTRNILAQAGVVEYFAKDVREVLTRHDFLEDLYKSLSKSKWIRDPEDVDADLAVITLSNLLDISSSVRDNFNAQSKEVLTDFCIVVNELLGRAQYKFKKRNLEQDSDSEPEDQESKHPLVPLGYKFYEGVDSLLNSLTPMLSDRKHLTNIFMSDGLSSASALILRLMDNSVQFKHAVLSTLAVNSKVADKDSCLLYRLWKGCAKDKGDFPTFADMVLLQQDSTMSLGDRAPMFVLFAHVYAFLLAVQDASEFYSYEMPFSREEVKGIASTMKGVLERSIVMSSENTSPMTVFGAHGLDAKKATAKLLNMLYARDCEAEQGGAFGGESFWTRGSYIPDFDEGLIKQVLTKEPVTPTLVAVDQLLSICPILIPFHARLIIFHETVNEADDFGLWGSRLQVSIKRDDIVEEAYRKLNHMRRGLRQRIRISFVSADGLEEAGIDGGGLFKEFMYELIPKIFSPDYGLMCETWEGKLYPNPASEVVVGDNHLDQFEFMGRMLGKALQSSLLLNVSLANFFIGKIVGRVSNLDDLRIFDPELYRNLLQVKSMPSETVEDLGLTFTIVKSELSGEEVDLIVNGGNVRVTAKNRLEYIYRVADYRLNRQIKPQAEAILRGLADVVDLEMVKMFSRSELQQLLQADTSKLDLVDLKKNTEYHGFHEKSEVIQWFWETVADMDTEEQRKLLKFVTSSPRAPLLGFKYLRPQLAIHKAEGDDRLPTSSTCVNLLKLPVYKSKNILREKLLYSITSNAGFDLS
ncbi:hypothetical protein NDN08_003625 [Rhodosorus marinus]|uniref:HECT-type E3 ubiquitin transferase n=1 Tax=Rhodosorus marinus TaxID=101924 RepID=A0AAV8UX18_9RHOD|nr:hypothetical protein NDN08_003625 [Rhodosorus marinus]